ncbi:MAG: endopeptidase La [Candidatus Hydrogenedentes bacterium]|nr:endopeptidase La [Candidatus Hydrogenedentota bacterium]
MASKVKSATTIQRIPLLPLKDVVVFPRMVMPLLVGRPGSLAAVEESLAAGIPVFLCAQKDPSVETPKIDELHKVGVAANVLQTLRMPDGTMKAVIEGLGRGRLLKVRESNGVIEAAVEPVAEEPYEGSESEALMRASLGQFEQYVKQSGRVAPEVVASMRTVHEANALADLLCAYLPLRVEERQELLEIIPVRERLERLSVLLIRETDMLDIEKKVRERIREQMDRGQREYFLHEQLKAIHQELGNKEGMTDESSELRAMIEKAGMPKEIKEKAMREFGRFERMPSMSPESAIIRTYIEWLAEMPWAKRTKDSIDLALAQKVLDEDHYGLAKVKERILEYLAVRKLSKSTKGPILCFVGPPGVGKTSLGRSIARSMGRKFIRVSLGGVRDEAEIRGHRRTYVGAMPGRIVQSIKKAGVKNPLFILDEIDKMSMDFRGDPSSALLEVLDPEQNTAFSDHYLEVDFDLHEVFFITTANSEDEIPGPLHDRMEIVRLSGYTSYEKERIAKFFLIPRQMTETGLTDKHIKFESSGIHALIQRYTREAGVRDLERRIANVCRKAARKIVENRKQPAVIVNETSVPVMLGPHEYSDLRADDLAQSGVAVGLAWTWAGGDVLHIETSTMQGKGILTLTGQLGDVMKESAHAAYTYLRSHARELRIAADFNRKLDLHVHVPEGAIPKDGPSAGVAMAVSMVSALRNAPPAERLAMTGEITLRGRVLPVGGIKEKLLAAHRGGIRTVILPKENEKDLVDIPAEIKNELRIVLVTEVDEALRIAFERPVNGAKKKSGQKARARK